MKYSFKHIFEYCALRAVSWPLNVLPYRAALFLGWCVAGFAFHVLRFRRKETFRRIRFVLGDDTPNERVRKIAWISLRNIVFNAIEMMRAHKIDRKWVERHIPDFSDAIPYVHQLVSERKGAVIAVPHCGNWDLAGWACAIFGVEMFSVAAKQKNPLVNDWMNRQRECGMTVLERGSGSLMLKQMIKMLRSGKVLAILPDVRMKTPDLELPFLGGTLNAGRGMAMFAIASNVPIVPAIFRREGWTKHVFTRFPTLYPDPSLAKEDDAKRLTSEVLDIVDRAIRETPEQWFWYNKRWVLTPVKKPKNQESKA